MLNSPMQEQNSGDYDEFDSLEIITDDRAISHWSEDEDEDGQLTPRLPTLDEDYDDDKDIFTLSKRNTRLPSRSGAWSSFSWTSLYDRGCGTNSSLSWADDELEKETTAKVKSLFKDIDDALYEGKSDNHENLSKDIQEECLIWRNKFPHLRVVGSHLDPQLKRVPKREDKRPRSRIPVRVIATSNKADQVDKEEETIEETYASHGNFSKEDPKLTDGLTLNDRFEENPQAYFEEKVMTAVFRKVWSQLSEELTTNLNDVCGEKAIQDSLEMLSLSSRESSAATIDMRAFANSMSDYRLQSGRDTIDENAVFNGGTTLFFDRPGAGVGVETRADTGEGNAGLGASRPYAGYLHQYHQAGTGTSAIILEENDQNPISLPNLRPVASSAAASSMIHENNQDSLKRPISSQLGARPRRARSFKVSTATTKRGDLTNLKTFVREKNPSNNELMQQQQLEEEPAKTNHRPYQRMRSQSGSPPQRRTPTLLPAISLPPIRVSQVGGGTGSVPPSSSLGSLQPNPGSIKPSSSSPPPIGTTQRRSSTAGSTLMGAGTTIRSLASGPAEPRAISVSGRRLKSLRQAKPTSATAITKKQGRNASSAFVQPSRRGRTTATATTEKMK